MSRTQHVELAIAWTRVAILVVSRHRITNAMTVARRHMADAKAMPNAKLPG